MEQKSGYNILIVDDDQFFIEGIKEYFRKRKIAQSLWIAYRAEEALDLISNNNIDILISDISLPDFSGIILCEKIKKQYNIKIIVITQFLDREHIRPLFNIEVDAIIDKKTAKKDTLTAIKSVSRGKKFYSESIDMLIKDFFVKRKKTTRTSTIILTKREKLLLPYIAAGYSNDEIAQILENLPEKIISSPYTIRTHRNNIYKKFKVRNPAQLQRKARMYGFLDEDV